MSSTPIKYFAITYQNGLTFYAKGESILKCVSVSRGMCGRVIYVRKLTAKEYDFRKVRKV